MSRETIANCLMLWLCCLYPLLAGFVGYRIARGGGVRATLDGIITKLPLPWMGGNTARPVVTPAARDERLY